MGKSLVYRPNICTSTYKPKSDCFAYLTIDKINGCAECTALDALYCAENPVCRFYKKRKTDEENGGDRDGR